MGGIFDDEGIKLAQTRFRAQFQGLQKKHGKSVIVFPEMELLQGMTSEEFKNDYIDPIHAGQKIHNILSDHASKLVLKAGWNTWDRLDGKSSKKSTDAAALKASASDKRGSWSFWFLGLFVMLLFAAGVVIFMTPESGEDDSQR